MKVGIIGAMAVEVRLLIEAMEEKTAHTYATRTFYEGRIRGTEAVVVQCGIGKINAALCVQVLKDMFNVDCVINTGVAGSLNNDIDIGDIVISRDAVQHDFSVGGLGYPPGKIPGIDTAAFAADERLVRKIAETTRSCLKD
ncbi:MAG: 5'-methylthioadenosine/S-adenosylhomocysteine nucleosidase, partial [Solobacterium sp.]|nr:5'-methylthioadenosine/S-adenosylhomocysteine nucleosidase [Solobacterium sp.]